MTAVVCEALAVSGFIVDYRNVVTVEALSKYCVISYMMTTGAVERRRHLGTSPLPLPSVCYTLAGRHRYYTALRIAYVHSVPSRYCSRKKVTSEVLPPRMSIPVDAVHQVLFLPVCYRPHCVLLVTENDH